VSDVINTKRSKQQASAATGASARLWTNSTTVWRGARRTHVHGQDLPDHWSFMLGEIALYSFLILLVTGVFLTLYFIRVRRS